MLRAACLLCDILGVVIKAGISRRTGGAKKLRRRRPSSPRGDIAVRKRGQQAVDLLDMRHASQSVKSQPVVQSLLERAEQRGCGAVRCGAVRCGAVRCGAVRCGAVHCIVAHRSTVHGTVTYRSTALQCTCAVGGSRPSLLVIEETSMRFISIL